MFAFFKGIFKNVGCQYIRPLGGNIFLGEDVFFIMFRHCATRCYFSKKTPFAVCLMYRDANAIFRILRRTFTRQMNKGCFKNAMYTFLSTQTRKYDHSSTSKVKCCHKEQEKCGHIECGKGQDFSRASLA